MPRLSNHLPPDEAVLRMIPVVAALMKQRATAPKVRDYWYDPKGWVLATSCSRQARRRPATSWRCSRPFLLAERPPAQHAVGPHLELAQAESGDAAFAPLAGRPQDGPHQGLLLYSQRSWSRRVPPASMRDDVGPQAEPCVGLYTEPEMRP